VNAYFQMSTANPTGQRPWNFVMNGTRLGQMHGRGVGHARLGRFGRLGLNILSALPASAQTQVTNIIQYLKQAQADINATNQLILQGNAAGIDMRDIATQNNANQQQLATLSDEFTTGYRAMTGTVPPGLSGLGQVDPVSWTTIAGAAAALAILAGLTYSLIQYTSANRIAAQTKLTTAQTQQSSVNQQNALLNQAAAAYAAGDTAQGDLLNSLASQAGASAAGASPTGAGGNPTDWNAWLQQNAFTLGLVAVAIFVGPTLIKKVL
jgi:hypothetical protein